MGNVSSTEGEEFDVFCAELYKVLLHLNLNKPSWA